MMVKKGRKCEIRDLKKERKKYGRMRRDEKKGKITDKNERK